MSLKAGLAGIEADFCGPSTEPFRFCFDPPVNKELPPDFAFGETSTEGSREKDDPCCYLLCFGCNVRLCTKPEQLFSRGRLVWRQ
jgi:hypothetical protein